MQNQKTECFVLNVKMAADSGKENIQRSDTNCWGRKAVNAEDHMTIYVEEPAYRRCKTEYAQRQKERERHKEYLY